MERIVVPAGRIEVAVSSTAEAKSFCSEVYAVIRSALMVDGLDHLQVGPGEVRGPEWARKKRPAWWVVDVVVNAVAIVVVVVVVVDFLLWW